jgi:hypothetical protein
MAYLYLKTQTILPMSVINIICEYLLNFHKFKYWKINNLKELSGISNGNIESYIYISRFTNDKKWNKWSMYVKYKFLYNISRSITHVKYVSGLHKYKTWVNLLLTDCIQKKFKYDKRKVKHIDIIFALIKKEKLQGLKFNDEISLLF